MNIIIVVNILFLSLFIVSVFGGTDIFTSTDELKKLIPLENKLITFLESYLDAEYDRIEIIQKQINSLIEHFNNVNKDPSYLENPLNAYQIIKKLTTDWDVIYDYIKEATPNVINTIDETQLPSKEDLIGAAFGLQRLVHTFELDILLFADGIINEKQYNTSLTADDVLEVGYQLYSHGDYKNAILWLEAARKKLSKEDPPTIENPSIIIYFLAKAYFKLDDLVNFAKYEKLFEPPYTNNNKPVKLFESVQLKYHKLCRGEQLLSNEYIAQLKCKYLTNNNPFLYIGPAKVEELHKNPDVLLFHEIFSDKESEIIKEMAQTHLERSRVRDDGASEYRISQTAWLDEPEHISNTTLDILQQRIEDFTGLSKNSSESFQVVNYGIGGQYDLHYDSLIKEIESDTASPEEFIFKHRVATVLIYMTDVPAGGYTAFPYLNIGVKPLKNSAVFWYNLFPSGNGDPRTLHAGCPVLQGTKWICNKWIQELHQLHRRPCLTTMETEMETISE